MVVLVLLLYFLLRHHRLVLLLPLVLVQVRVRVTIIVGYLLVGAASGCVGSGTGGVVEGDGLGRGRVIELDEVGLGLDSNGGRSEDGLGAWWPRALPTVAAIDCHLL